MNKKEMFEKYKEIIRYGKEFEAMLNKYMNKIEDMTSEEKTINIS